MPVRKAQGLNGGVMAIPDESGPSTPSWIKDDDSVEVDINRLEDFALRVKRELELNFGPSFEHGILPNLKDLAKKAPFGRGGLPEGKIFQASHVKNLEAVVQMMADVQKGLLAISLAANSIAAEYSSGDALSKATIDDVSAAFAPVEGKGESLSSLLNKAAAEEPKGDVKLPAAIVNNEKAEPADLSQRDEDYGSEVRPSITIAEGESNEYYIPADDENIETRKPGSDAPK
jgi:hypothetical protein